MTYIVYLQNEKKKKLTNKNLFKRKKKKKKNKVEYNHVRTSNFYYTRFIVST